MSVSSVSLSSDANVRYQRLAQEYAKLRAQAKVLREGVLEERSKADKLIEEVKSKEATIRRLQSENEALTFRNEQLTVRVEQFQLQAHAHKPSPRKPPTSSGAHQKTSEALHPNVEILEQELRRKLSENENLVSRLAESERQHAVEMAEMSEKLAREMRKLEEQVRTMRMKTSAKKKDDDDVKQIQKANHRNSGVPVEIASPEPPESHEEAKFMVAEAARGAFFAFHNVFSLLQQRSEIYPYDVTMERLPAHVEKLSSEYAQTARLFSDLTAILDVFLTSSEPLDVSTIASKCRLISQHCHQMLSSLIIQMTCEESKVTWCTPPLAALNDEWKRLMLRMFDIFEHITEQAVEPTDYEGVVAHLETLEDVVLQMVDCFQKRWVFESRLPTTTRRMRCVGQALEKAIQMMAQETSKLHARAKRVQMMPVSVAEELAEPVELEESEEPEEPEEVTPEHFEQKEPMNPFDEDPPEDVNHTEASETATELPAEAQESTLQSVDRAPTPTENAPKSEEIQILRQKYEALQKERDKLFVEFSLCKRKLEISMNEGAKMEKSDMNMIWDIGMQRRDEWIGRVESAEKAVQFYQNELEQLLRHELESEEHLKKIVVEMDELSRQNQKLEDELESVRRSYESQLGDLSDHLANLVNEKEKEKEGSKSRGSLKSFFNKSSS